MMITKQQAGDVSKSEAIETSLLTTDLKRTLCASNWFQLLFASKLTTPSMRQKCIGRESNPGLAESSEMTSLMATANFTTKPPMQLMEQL